MVGRTLGSFVVMALILTGCGGAQAGNSTPAGSTSMAAQPTSDSAGQTTNSQIPKVTRPIDTASFEEEPCSVLTDAQLQELSISTNPQPSATAAGPTCAWGDSSDDGIHISGTFITKKSSSVAGLYESNELGRYAYFVPVTIHGYPAAFSQLADSRQNGGCAIAIGVKNDLLYSMGIRLGLDNPNYAKPCSELEKVAEMAINTMTQGGS